MLPVAGGPVAAVLEGLRTRLRRALGGDDARALVDALAVAAVRVDAAERVGDITPRAAAVLGVDRARAVGAPLADVAPALAALEDLDGATVSLPTADDGEPYAVTVPGGEGAATDGWVVLRPAVGAAAAGGDGAGAPTADPLLDVVPVGVVVVDADGAFVAVNDRAASLLGVDPASLAGTTVADLRRRGVLGPEVPEQEALADAPEGADATGAGSYEVTVRPPGGGDERVVEARLAPRPGEGFTGVVGVLRDVTDRQRRLDELEQYEAIMEVLPDPVYATDAEGQLTFVNRAFEEQLGYPRGETGMHFSEFTTAEDTERVLDLLREMVGDDGPERTTAEIAAVTRDGRQLRVEDSIALLPGDEEFRGSAGVLRDVTERKRRQEVLTVMNRALRHNLRTNVTTIVGYADLLDREVDGEAESYVDRVRDSAEWLAKLGDALRTLQRAVEADSAEEGGEAVAPVVDSVVGAVADDHPDADVDTHVTTSGSLAAEWPLQYALQNVLENAVVHHDREEPSVDVWVADAPRDGWIDIHVEDDGPGIPEDERDVVLGEATITQLQHGSGIGLWITRWLVEVFDGELVIEDNDPRGTVVTLRLPRSA